jgi:predicted DNA-binding WGR domain protein
MSILINRLLGRRGRDKPESAGAEEDLAHDGPQGDRRYLEFVGGTSAKFYAVVLHGDDDDAWTVSFNFGRIGRPRDWAVKVDALDQDEGREAFDELIDEKLRGGYQLQPWPANLAMPDEASLKWPADADAAEAAPDLSQRPRRYRAEAAGTLPQPDGARLADTTLPSGVLISPDGDPDQPPVIWISRKPVERLDEVWRALARGFSQTGLWPLIMELEIEPEDMTDTFMESGGGEGGNARTVLARWWSEGLELDEEFDKSTYAPLGRRFPGLAQATVGDRSADIERHVSGAAGRLGLVAVQRPADVLGATQWSGAANYDADPADQSTVLRSWEERFDAYVVGLGRDTLIVAVGAPPQNRNAATGIAAEHLAFCPDNIWQGAGTVGAYLDELIKAPLWHFWWD